MGEESHGVLAEFQRLDLAGAGSPQAGWLDLMGRLGDVIELMRDPVDLGFVDARVVEVVDFLLLGREPLVVVGVLGSRRVTSPRSLRPEPFTPLLGRHRAHRRQLETG